MDYKTLLPAILALMFGVLLIGQGLTGYVVSESCCFPPNCALENMCDSASPNLESTAHVYNTNSVYLGFIIVICSMVLYIIMQHNIMQHKL